MFPSCEWLGLVRKIADRAVRDDDMTDLLLEKVLLLGSKDFLQEVHGTVPDGGEIDLA